MLFQSTTPASYSFLVNLSGRLLVLFAWLVRLVLFLFLVRGLTLMTRLMLLLLTPVRLVPLLFLVLWLSLFFLLLVIHE